MHRFPIETIGRRIVKNIATGGDELADIGIIATAIIPETAVKPALFGEDAGGIKGESRLNMPL
jgi:hypothetical protein